MMQKDTLKSTILLQQPQNPLSLWDACTLSGKTKEKTHGYVLILKDKTKVQDIISKRTKKKKKKEEKE